MTNHNEIPPPTARNQADWTRRFEDLVEADRDLICQSVERIRRSRATLAATIPRAPPLQREQK
jgi:hypothetical protein